MLTNVSGKFHYVLQNKTKKLSICVVRFMRTKAVCMEDCFLDCTTQLINNNIQWFLLTLNWAQLFFILFIFQKFSTTIDKIIFLPLKFHFHRFYYHMFYRITKIHYTFNMILMRGGVYNMNLHVFKLMIRSIIIVL